MSNEETRIEPDSSPPGHTIMKYIPAASIPLPLEQEVSPPLLRHLSFSSSGKFLAGSFVLKLCIWTVAVSKADGREIETWTLMTEYPLEGGPDDEISYMAWAKPDVLLAGATTGDVLVISMKAEGTSAHVFLASKQPVRYLALNKHSTHLAIVSGDNYATVWTVVPKNTEESLHSEPDIANELWELKYNIPGPVIHYQSDEDIEVTFIGWNEADPNLLVLAYLHHGVRSWDLRTQRLSTLLDLDNVIYAGALSPDGRYFSVPNRKSAFDIFDLKTKERLSRLCDPDLTNVNAHQSLRNRPGRFVHEGRYFIGAGLGKVNLWHVGVNLRAQRLSLGDGLSQSDVTLLAVSDTDATPSNDIRVAACTQGPLQEIVIWKARPHGRASKINISFIPDDFARSLPFTGSSASLLVLLSCLLCVWCIYSGWSVTSRL